MPKPPPTPPHSDINGVFRDNIAPNDPRRWDQQAQTELEARNRESVGRPDQDHADEPKDVPASGAHPDEQAPRRP